ncbi:MAG: tetratricopeptide repeat protein [Burkholderiales bacterium]|jgi:class 3 adenylate cyclase/tetratricopeptide (TPR) repeat protein|nr:tetratricopeptide repeat protein [Burkholderiales bacterium]
MAEAQDARPIRRLAAVMLADVAGYSRMMEEDDTGTHQRLRELRATVIDRTVAAYQGRPVRSKGDDLLAEFASAGDALACAVQIQREVRTRNLDRPADEQLQLRIGINLGDILIDGDDIAGDGVNVAARLQALAEPGLIAISAAVREQVRAAAGLRVSDAGAFKVKNISRPIRVFRVDVLDRPPPWGQRLRAALRRRRRVLVLSTAVVVAAALGATTMHWRSTQAPPALSLALHPVTDASGTPAGKAVALALSQQLTEVVLKDLGTARVVVARSALGNAADPGREAPTRYSAHLRVIEAGDRIAVAASVDDRRKGAQVWAGTVAVDAAPGEAAPVELLAQLSFHLSREVARAASALLASEAPDDPLLALLTAEQYYRETDSKPATLREAARRFALAAQGLPNLARPLAGEAESWAYLYNRSRGSDEGRAALARADELSAQAIALGPMDANAWRVRAVVLTFKGEEPSAREAIERALQLNRYSAEAHIQRGVLAMYTGRQAQALEDFERATRLSPTASSVGDTLYHRARALLLLGRYDAAIETGRRALAFVPEWPDFMVLTAAYAMKGDAERAAWARAELLRRDPDFTIAGWRSSSAIIGAEALEQHERHLVAGLRRAGVPE